MPEREHQHKPRGISKWERDQKARIRRDNAPSGPQILEMRSRAMHRLEKLDLELLIYITEDKTTGTGLDQTITAHDAQTSTQFAKCVSHKINKDLKDLPSHDVIALGRIALLFTERMWIESALELVKHDEKTTVLEKFLDSCDNSVTAYLEKQSSVSNLNRLQEVRNKVINPITNQLDIKEL